MITAVDKAAAPANFGTEVFAGNCINVARKCMAVVAQRAIIPAFDTGVWFKRIAMHKISEKVVTPVTPETV